MEEIGQGGQSSHIELGENYEQWQYVGIFENDKERECPLRVVRHLLAWAGVFHGAGAQAADICLVALITMVTKVRKGYGLPVEDQSTKDKIVSATLEIMKSEGLENLTLRTLGSKMHMHHTALYRYFATKDDLLSAVFVRLAGSLLLEVNDQSIAPRDRLRQLCCGLRGMFHEYPSLAPAVVVSAGPLPQAQTFQIQIVGMLREMGVAEVNLARCYQALETHVIGGSYYDYTSAPDHLSQRRARYRAANDESLDRNSRKDADIDALNEATFAWVLDLILDGAIRH